MTDKEFRRLSREELVDIIYVLQKQNDEKNARIKELQATLDDGATMSYTRHGAWYGDWCAMYVSFCLNYAGMPHEAVPYEASCPKWTEQNT